MATVIQNQPTDPNRTLVVDSSDNTAGWAVAVLVLLVVIVAGALWYTHYRGAYAAPAAAPGTTVQVNLPASGGNSQPSGSSATPAPAGSTGY